jgi:hypothetical protein
MTVGDQGGQIVGFEVLQRRPQANVGRAGLLGLHAGQQLDGVESREFLGAQQHLPFQQAAVERAPV